MIATTFRIMGGILAALLFVVMGLATIKGSPSWTTVNTNVLASAYLEKNKDSYAKCANSIGGEGDILIGRVAFNKLRSYSLDRLNSIEDSYKAQINEQCSKPVTDYEENYAALERTEKEIASSSQSLLAKFMGWQAEVNDSKLRAYQPNLVKFTAGNPLTNLVFTEADVEQYFTDNL